ncbi:hypothetical protein D3C87_177120 [compost metagenome]
MRHEIRTKYQCLTFGKMLEAFDIKEKYKYHYFQLILERWLHIKSKINFHSLVLGLG